MAYVQTKGTEYNRNRLWELTEEQAHALALEMWDDPKELGYAGRSAVQVEALLNDRRVINAEETILVDAVDPSDIQDAFEWGEYANFKRKATVPGFWYGMMNGAEQQALADLWAEWEDIIDNERPVKVRGPFFKALREELRQYGVIERDTYLRMEALTTRTRPVPQELEQRLHSRTDILFGTGVAYSSFIYVTAADIELIWKQKGKDPPTVNQILQSFGKR